GAAMAGMPLHRGAQLLEPGLPAVALGALRIDGELLALEVAQLATDPRVLAEVAAIARHRGRVAGERLLLRSDAVREIDDGAVGLELRERGLEDVARHRAAEL